MTHGGAGATLPPVAYPVENALFQWEDGARRVREAPEPEQQDLEEAVDRVVEELRKRLGSTFTLEELGDLYGADVDWASQVAQSARAGTDSQHVVDAAFSRYAREATNYGGGKRREPF